MKFGLICYWRINMKFGLIYCWWINWKLVHLDLLLYCIWWLIWDIWIISIAYCLFGLGPIVNWLCVWPYWIGLSTLLPLAIYIINVGLLIGYLFRLIRLNLKYYFLWPYIFFYVDLLIDVNFGAHNVSEICWMIWIFDMSLAHLNYLIWT